MAEFALRAAPTAAFQVIFAHRDLASRQRHVPGMGEADTKGNQVLEVKGKVAGLLVVLFFFSRAMQELAIRPPAACILKKKKKHF